MKKHLLIVISLFLLAVNANAAKEGSNVLYSVSDLVKSGVSNNSFSCSGILPASVCIGRAPLSSAQIDYFATNNRYIDYMRTHRLTRRELSRIGRAIVHMGHEKFWSDPATQNGITVLSWIAPIGKCFTFLSNIIHTGAKLIIKQAAKEVTKGGFKSVGAAAKGYNKTIQTSGHTLKNSTLKALNLTKE